MNGRIAGFYGYKGGSGRSFMLANVAWVLAAGAGRSVLVVDVDLEAPGLGDFFAALGYRVDRLWRENPGMVGLVNAYGHKRDAKGLRRVLRRAGALDPVETKGRTDGPPNSHVLRLWTGRTRGVLDLLGPGRLRDQEPDADYAEAIIQAEWNEFYRIGGGYFFQSLGTVLRESYDHILLDLRTGFSGATARAAATMADDIVLFATPAFQSIVGLRDMRDWFRRERTRLIDQELVATELRIRPALTRVEYGRPAETPVALFREIFGNEPIIVPYLPGLQVEQLVRSPEPVERPITDTRKSAKAPGEELVGAIDQLAGWLAEDARINRSMADRSLDKIIGPPKVEITGEDLKPYELIERARRLLKRYPRPVAFRPGGDPGTPTDPEGEWASEVPKLQDSYRELRLHAAELLDTLVANAEEEERELLREVLGIAAPPAGKAEDRAAIIADRTDQGPTPIEIQALERAGAAVAALDGAAFADDGEKFAAARAEVEEIAQDMASKPGLLDSVLGFHLLNAASLMRELGGDWYADAERWVRQAWRSGSLASSGEPPPDNEASGIVTFAFLLGSTGRVGASRTTLEQLYRQLGKADSDMARHVRKHWIWWDKVMGLFGPDVAEAAAGLVSIAPRRFDPALLGWQVLAFGWRGETAEALRRFQRHRQRQREADPSERGESLRVAHLRNALTEAELRLTLGDIAGLQACLAAAGQWSTPTQIYEIVTGAYRARLALIRALVEPSAGPAALQTAADLIGEGKVAAPRSPPTAGDIRHRHPTVVRAALTAVRLGDASARTWLGQARSALASVADRNMWTAEQAYLLARAHDALHGTRTATAALRRATALIAGEDKAVARSAAAALKGQAETWLQGFQPARKGARKRPARKAAGRKRPARRPAAGTA